MLNLLKEKWFVEIVAVSLSVISTFISILSLKISKTQTINSAITKNRIDWISDVRALVQQFIEEYLKGNAADPYMKRVLATKIKLYLRNNSDSYKVFIKNLDRCTMNRFNEGDYQLLVAATQDMLNSVWVRMKREAGINSRSEKKIKERLEREKANNN